MAPLPRAARRPSCLWNGAQALARLGRHTPTTFAFHTTHEPAETQPWDRRGRFVGRARFVEVAARPEVDRPVALARQGSGWLQKPTARTPMTAFRADFLAEKISKKSACDGLEEIFLCGDAWRLPASAWCALHWGETGFHSRLSEAVSLRCGSFDLGYYSTSQWFGYCCSRFLQPAGLARLV